MCALASAAATIPDDARAHRSCGPEDFFNNISPRHCSLHLQAGIVYAGACACFRPLAPSARSLRRVGRCWCVSPVRRVEKNRGQVAATEQSSRHAAAARDMLLASL